MSIKLQIREEFNRVDSLARTLFPVYASMSVPTLTFFIRGRTAGWAKYNAWEVSINSHVAAQSIAQMKDTVSHEIAHIVAFAVYGERGHGAAWKRVHRMLGGSASRTYSPSEHGITTIAGRRTNWYLYRLPSGEELWVGPRHHNALHKRGAPIRSKASGVRILPEHFTGQTKVKS